MRIGTIMPAWKSNELVNRDHSLHRPTFTADPDGFEIALPNELASALNRGGVEMAQKANGKGNALAFVGAAEAAFQRCALDAMALASLCSNSTSRRSHPIVGLALSAAISPRYLPASGASPRR